MSVDELETLLVDLLKDLRARGVKSVDSGDLDLYWTISSDDWCLFEKTPDLLVGSLQDDILEAHQSAGDPSRRTLVDLERCANLLRLLATQAAGPKGSA